MTTARDMGDPTASKQAGSPADAHDMDKLVRWNAGLSTASGQQESAFPIYATFLVSGEDLDAHNVFRHYRSSFEELEAGFDNLMIFGQHGTSNTLLSFLSELGIAWERVPVLALTDSPTSTETLTISLPKGIGDETLDEPAPWNRALDLIGEAALAGTSLKLSALERVSVQAFSSGSLISTVETLLESLRADI